MPYLSHAQEIATPVSFKSVAGVKLSFVGRQTSDQVQLRNLVTGRSVILRFREDDSGMIPASRFESVVDGPDGRFLPEWSLLVSMAAEEEILPGQAVPGTALRRRTPNRASRVFWRKVGFRSLTGANGQLIYEVDPTVQTVVLASQDAARRRKAREQAALTRLFDVGWKALGIRRFDLAAEAFERVLGRKTLLENDQRAQAHLGLGIAVYNTKGCAAAAEELIEADRDPGNRDDVSFYKALCYLDERDYARAQPLFKELADKRHVHYGDQGVFYQGVMAEAEERYEDAEGFYLDASDFARDPALAQSARQRLAVVRGERAAYAYDHKLFSGGLSAGLGYDNNVAALPGDLSPAVYGLSSETSSYFSGIGFFSLSLPWAPVLEHRINYALIVQSYLADDLSELFDSSAHDLGTSFAWRVTSTATNHLSFSYTSILLGPFADASESLRIYNASYAWKQMYGANTSRPSGRLDASLSLSWVRPLADPLNENYDLSAEGIQVQLKHRMLYVPGHSFGPSLRLEARPSEGRENSVRSLSLGFNWDQRLSAKAEPWTFGQDLSFDHLRYYESPRDRRDWVLKYAASLGKTWDGWFDARLQGNASFNFSSLKEIYQYDKWGAALVLSAYF